MSIGSLKDSIAGNLSGISQKDPSDGAHPPVNGELFWLFKDNQLLNLTMENVSLTAFI